MTAKEIWYIWDGQSPIPGNATRYIDRNGHHHIPRFTIAFPHGGFGAGGEIVAYTLGETRKRVWCSCYGGMVLIDIDDQENELWDRCPDCQGRGYIWKTEVTQ